MKVSPTPIPEMLVLEPNVFSDARGFFFESFNQAAITESGIVEQFVQDNHSFSKRNVLRGLHYQIERAQAKLVRVVSGEIFDVAVDLRRSSSAFGKWHGVRLSAQNRLMTWIPKGLAHGFVVLSDGADVLYKATDFYAPELERTLAWNDPDLGIQWPIDGTPVVSAKDALGKLWREAETFA